MKRWILNSFCLLVAILAGVLSFLLKYRVIEKEDELDRIHHQILADKREIHMLQAEWIHLNDPERLRALIASQTGFQAINSKQIIRVEDIPYRPAPVPAVKPNFYSSEETAHAT